MRRYVSASRKLSKAAGKVRDTDMIAAWTMQISEGKDKRSFITDLERLRASNLRPALLKAKKLRKIKSPSLDVARPRRLRRAEARREGREAPGEESRQGVRGVPLHTGGRGDARAQEGFEASAASPGAHRKGEAPPLLGRLRSIQDDLGAIRDHDLVIDYLRSRVRLTSTRSLIREEIAKRHARLEDFVTKNRGQGHLIPVSADGKA